MQNNILGGKTGGVKNVFILFLLSIIINACVKQNLNLNFSIREVADNSE